MNVGFHPVGSGFSNHNFLRFQMMLWLESQPSGRPGEGTGEWRSPTKRVAMSRLRQTAGPGSVSTDSVLILGLALKHRSPEVEGGSSRFTQESRWDPCSWLLCSVSSLRPHDMHALR